MRVWFFVRDLLLYIQKGKTRLTLYISMVNRTSSGRVRKSSILLTGPGGRVTHLLFRSIGTMCSLLQIYSRDNTKKLRRRLIVFANLLLLVGFLQTAQH